MLIQNKSYNNDLQALRGLSILFVVYYHIVDMVPGLKASMGFFGNFFHGAYGVDLFFVISGYVITRSVYRNIDHIGRVNLRDGFRFWTRRVFRTIPPALIWLGFVLAIVLATGWFGSDVNNIAHAKAAFLQYANIFLISCIDNGTCGIFGYYWTLSTEEQFYLLLPLLMLLLTKRQLAWMMLLGGLILTILFSEVLALANLKFNLLHYLPIRVDGLMLGVAIALFQGTNFFQYTQNYFLKNPTVTLGVIFLMHLLLWTRGTPWGIPIIGAYIMNGLIAAVIVYIGVMDKGYSVFSPVVRPILSFFGNISFSLYLSHIIIILFIQNYLYTHWNLLPIDIGYTIYLPLLLLLLLIAVSYGSYRFIELPFQQIGRNLSNVSSKNHQQQNSNSIHNITGA